MRGKDGGEVKLQTYEDFQDPRIFDQAVFIEGIKKVSQRDYEKGVSKIANSFGFTKSSVSRKWIKATAKKLGVGSSGQKYVLGIYQADTENSKSCLNKRQRRAIRIRCYVHKWRNLE